MQEKDDPGENKASGGDKVRAEILSVGTELLLGEILDTNARYLSGKLRDAGIDVYWRVTVGDNAQRLTYAFEEALSRADIVIATGGLGPTDDDLTAECLARALGRELRFSEEAFQVTVDFVTKRGRLPTESERKQALIVDGGLFFPNPQGTAPGQAVSVDGKLAILLPGPPREMVPMFENYALPLIKREFPGLVPLVVKNLKLVGIPEAVVGEKVADLMASANPTLAPYAAMGEVRLRIAARSPSRPEAAEMVRRFEATVQERLGEFIYGSDDDTLESVCGSLLRKKGLSVAVAESVTGGLVSHRLTQVPGSSAYFKMGMVAYNPAVKSSCLGVSREAVEKNQAVNPEVARSMADGIRRLSGAKIGLATTGFAGPDGGSAEEPVGTVYIGLSDGEESYVERNIFVGNREAVKEAAAQRTLCLLWKYLTKRRR